MKPLKNNMNYELNLRGLLTSYFKAVLLKIWYSPGAKVWV
jgi:hypothetical protein